MDKNQLHFEANRALWNAKTQHHYNSAFYDMESFLAGSNTLDEIVINELKEVSGKSLLHLQCHFGQDTLSFARMGAEVTGIDLSDESIATAKNLATKLDLPAKFIRSNVYDTRAVLDEKFDLVFTSYGTITWLPDLDRWAKVVADSLKTGGRFYMAEFHPALMMYDHDTKKIAFQHDSGAAPFEEEEEGTYAQTDAKISMKEFFWNHSSQKVINALLGQNLKLVFFNEHYHSPYNCFSNLQEIAPKKYVFGDQNCAIPHVFSMLWRK